MTTNFVTQDDIIDGSLSGPGDMWFLYGKADFVTFFHGGNAVIAIAENNATINLQQSFGTTIYDFSQGMHLNLDPFTPLTTIRNFQLDPTASIDLFNSAYSSQLDMADHLQVIQGYGTVLNPATPRGGPPLQFPGDYAVNTGQIHLHPNIGISGS